MRTLFFLAANRGRSLALAVLLALGLSGAARPAGAHCSVWKVTDASGHTLYLAGSVHALRPSDYPLPKAYDDALAASSGLSFEFTPTTTAEKWNRAFAHAAELPSGVKLKDRVDPRTYAYLLKVLGRVRGATDAEQRISHLRPWAVAFLVSSPDGTGGVSRANGVERYCLEKARHEHKQLDGLVSLDQHIAVFGGMSDADSEAELLLAFIHLNTESKEFERTVDCWKKGDLAGLEKVLEDDYREVPSVRQRLLSDRNKVWVPKIEGYLSSGKTWTVLAGVGHMAGDEGVPALLRARGYKVEQL